ncbi:hypothetical protein HJC23_001663 [Cyclotella cryptica]|uniref:PUB domain-containing protein n=1 Tax=Cyclotella cryptica TaxID=29204 RepID=A0ABD3QMM9_9STRA
MNSSEETNASSCPFAPSLKKLALSLQSHPTPHHQACIVTILRIIDNILQDPSRSNPKLRKIKVANPAFWKRAAQWDGCIAFLTQCGFTASGAGGAGVPQHLKLERESEESRQRLVRGRQALVAFAVGCLELTESLLPACPLVPSQPVVTTSDDVCDALDKVTAVDLSPKESTPGLIDYGTPVAALDETTATTAQTIRSPEELLLMNGSPQTICAEQSQSVNVSLGDDNPKKEPPKSHSQDLKSNEPPAPQDPEIDKGLGHQVSIGNSEPAAGAAAAAAAETISFSVQSELSVEFKSQKDSLDCETKETSALALDNDVNIEQREIIAPVSDQDHNATRKSSSVTASDAGDASLGAKNPEKQDSASSHTDDREANANVEAMKLAILTEHTAPPQSLKDESNNVVSCQSSDATLSSNEHLHSHRMETGLDRSRNSENFPTYQSSPTKNETQSGIQTEPISFTINASSEVSSSQNQRTLTLVCKENAEIHHPETNELDDLLQEIYNELSDSVSNVAKNMSPHEKEINDVDIPAADSSVILNHNTKPTDAGADTARIAIDDKDQQLESTSDEQSQSQSKQQERKDSSVRQDEVTPSKCEAEEFTESKENATSLVISSQKNDVEKNESQTPAICEAISINESVVDQRCPDEVVRESEKQRSGGELHSENVEAISHVSDSNGLAENQPLSTQMSKPFLADKHDKYHLLFQEIPLPEGEFSSPDDDDVDTFRLGFELCHRLLISLWHTESSLPNAPHLSMQSEYITKGLANVKPWTESVNGDQSSNCNSTGTDHGEVNNAANRWSDSGPALIVPFGIVYEAWACLLNMDDDAATRSRGMYSWILSNHPDLSSLDDIPVTSSSLGFFASTSEANISLCNYMCNNLRNCGLITVYAADIIAFDDDVPPELSFFVGVKEAVLRDYIDNEKSIVLDEGLVNECHNMLANLVSPRINKLLENDKRSRNECALLWYSCRSAVHHLLLSQQLDEAEQLLLDRKFTRARLDSMGILRAVNTHCWEYARIIQYRTVASKIEQSNKQQAVNDNSGNVTAAELLHLSLERSRQNCLNSFYGLSEMLREQVKKISSDNKNYRLKELEELGISFQTVGESIGSMGGTGEEEMKQYEEALTLKTEAYGGNQNHESIADTLYAMGCYHQRCRSFALGQKCYEQSLKIYKATLGYDHPCIAKVLYNIGIMYVAQKNFSVAMKCLKKSLSIRQSSLGDNDLSVADSLCWIGNIHRENRELNEARECFLKAHSVKVAVLGKDHSECSEIMQNLESVNRSLLYYKEAMLSRRANVSGPYDVEGIDDLCESLHAIANVYRVIGQFQRALQFSEQILKRRRALAALARKSQVTKLFRSYEDVIALTKLISRDETGGIDKDKFAQIGNYLVDIGKLHEHRLNKPMKALLYYQEATEVFKEVNDYRQIQACLSLMGTIHVHASSNEKALACFSKALVLTRTKEKESSSQQQSICDADLLHNIGNCKSKKGDYKKSVISFRDSLKIKKALLPANNISVAKTEHCIALALLQIGDFDEALAFFQSSLKTRQDKLGAHHLDVGFSLHNIGKIYFHQGKVDESMDCLERALEIKRGSITESLAETEHILASLYMKKERYYDAMSLLNSALSAYKQIQGCELLSSDVLDLLGQAYGATGDLKGAIAVYEESLKIKRTSLSPDHIACANVLMEIGKLQASNNELEGALVTFKEVKRLHKIHYEKDHLRNADMLIAVGSVQSLRFNHQLAKRCFFEALRIRRMLLEEKSTGIAEALTHLGRVYRDINDHKAAIACFVQAGEIYGREDSRTTLEVRRLLGISQLKSEHYEDATSSFEACLRSISDSHSNEWISVAYDLATAKIKSGKKDGVGLLLDKCILVAKQNDIIDERLAKALFQYGQLRLKDDMSTALSCFEESLVIRKEVGSAIEISEVIFEVGKIHEMQKQYPISLDDYKESLKLRQSVNAEDEKTADILFRMGEVYRVCGNLDLAFTNLTVALGAYYMAVGKNHPSVANTLHSLGYICEAKNDIPEAIRNHKMGFEVRKLNVGKDHPLVASSLDDIAGLYQKLGEHDKALLCLKEGLRIRRLQGSDSMEIATTLFAMGIIFAATNDNEKATECYNASLDISCRDGSNPKLEAQTLHQIGCMHASQRQYREALQKWR